MTNIYIVTAGEYSNYQIHAVFSSEEKAKEFIGTDDDYEIEVYPVDAWGTLPPGKHVWAVFMNRDGTGYARENDSEWHQHAFQDNLYLHWYGWSQVWALRGHVLADSEQHALKIANEQRTQWIATGEWEAR